MKRALWATVIVVSWTTHVKHKTIAHEKTFTREHDAAVFWNDAPSCHIPTLDEQLVLHTREHCNLTELGFDIDSFKLVKDGVQLYGN